MRRFMEKVLAIAVLSLPSFLAAGVLINEVCWKNDRFDDGTGTLTSDWVELYNNGASAVDVGGYSIGKKKSYADCGDKLFILPSYSLDPGEFLVVYFDKGLPPATNWVETVVNGRTKRVPWIRSNVFALGTSEVGALRYQDDVRLFDNTRAHNRLSNIRGEDVAVVLDKNISYGSLWDGNVNAYGETADEGCVVFASPTPWTSNAAGFTMEAPALSVPPGVYASRLSVTATCSDARAEILYYTLDGSDPRSSPTRRSIANGGTVLVDARVNATVASGMSQTNAWIRTSPVELAERVPGAGWQTPVGSVPRLSPLRVVAAYGPGYSAEAGGSYLVGDAFSARTLPVVSLLVNEDDFFSDAHGLYVPGTVYASKGYGSTKWGKPNANYFAEDAEVRARFELLEVGASRPALALDLGVSLLEGNARALPQKSLVCALRGAEYGTRDLTYDLIPELGEKTFKRFVLDTGGREWSGPLTDGVSTLLKDAVFHRIASGLDLAVSGHRPVSVYVNGDYWGLHMVRESVDRHFFSTRYGLDADNVDILAHLSSGSDVEIEQVAGNGAAAADYEAFLKRLDEVDVATEAGYAVAKESMDVVNYMDYVISETFFANDDWPAENCVFWRTHTNEQGRADSLGDGRWRWRLTDLDLAGKEKDGIQGAWRDMLAFVSAKDMKDRDEPGFLINRLWKNATFREMFISRYVKWLDAEFRPDRTAEVVRNGARQIEDEVARHYRRWGRNFTKEQWSAAVERSLVDYLAQRWTNSFEHLDAKFSLGGVGDLSLTCGAGGFLRIDGEGEEYRWTGRRFAGRPVTVAAIPVEGFMFSGWSDGVLNATRAVQVPAGGSLALTATFVRASESFEVRFEPNGGTGMMVARTMSLASEQRLPPVAFSRDGYDFVGWATTATGPVVYADGAEVRDVAEVPSRVVTLYAVWASSVYHVAFSANGGTGEMPSRTFGVGESQILDMCLFTRTGYTFAGWSLAAEGKVAYRDGAEVVDLSDGGDVTLYAVWTANSYMIEFDANGGSGEKPSAEAIYDEAAVYGEAGFRRAGHVFAGWALCPEGPVVYAPGSPIVNLSADVGDVVMLYAVWSKNLLYPVEESSGILEGDTVPWSSAAVVYDGYVYDRNDVLRGTLQVKVGRANKRTQVSKVTAVFVSAENAKKMIFRNGQVGDNGLVDEMAQGGQTLRLTLGTRGMGGSLDAWRIDGARNIFSAKGVTEKAESDMVLKNFKSGCALAWSESAVVGGAPGSGWSGLSVVVGAKGKTKISGILASGANVSAMGQLLVGADRVCVPVIVAKKAMPAFEVWGTRTGWVPGVAAAGLGDVVAGRIGGPTFKGVFDDFQFPKGVSLGTKGYEGWRPHVAAMTGVLRGTFKVEVNTSGKPRKTSVSVMGVVVDGVGYATAVIRKRVSWAVMLR